MKRIGLLALAATVLSSCGIYKKYERPADLCVQAGYRDVAETAPEDSSLASMSWKELFKDPCLQRLIEKGLAGNSELLTAHLKVKEAEAVLQRNKLSFLPSAALSADGTLSSFDGSKATKAYSLAATASWEADIFGKVTNAKREAKAALEGSMAYGQAVRTKLIATIADGYYTLLMLDKQLAVNEENLKNWEVTIKTMELLKQAGEMNAAAVLQAQANQLALETAAWNTRQRIQEVENSLSTVLGVFPGTIKRGTLEKQQFPDSVALGVPIQLLAARPDVRQAEFELMRAFYAENAARAAFYPSLKLAGTAGWTNNLGSTIVDPAGLLLSAVGSLAQPLFSKGTNVANLEIAEARQKEAQIAFQQTLLKAGQEVNDALTQWQMANYRIALGISQVESLQKAVYKTELLMRHSSTNYLEVLTAQQSLLSAQLALAQSRFERIQGVIELYQALGGGGE